MVPYTTIYSQFLFLGPRKNDRKVLWSTAFLFSSDFFCGLTLFFGEFFTRSRRVGYRKLRDFFSRAEDGGRAGIRGGRRMMGWMDITRELGSLLRGSREGGEASMRGGVYIIQYRRVSQMTYLVWLILCSRCTRAQSAVTQSLLEKGS